MSNIEHATPEVQTTEPDPLEPIREAAQALSGPKPTDERLRAILGDREADREKRQLADECINSRQVLGLLATGALLALATACGGDYMPTPAPTPGDAAADVATDARAEANEPDATPDPGSCLAPPRSDVAPVSCDSPGVDCTTCDAGTGTCTANGETGVCL